MKLKLNPLFCVFFSFLMFLSWENILNAQARMVFGTASAVYLRMSGGTQVTPICLVLDNASNLAISCCNACGGAGTACPTAAAGSPSWIVSEGQYNYVVWRQIASPVSYQIPLGTTTVTTKYIPVTFNNTAGAANNLAISTYSTSSTDNTPWTGISNDLLGLPMAAVTNMYSSAFNQDGATETVIDRWWDINVTTAGITTASITFAYRGEENTMTSAPTGTLGVQHWSSLNWTNGKGGGDGTRTTTGQIGGTTAGTVYTATATGLTEFNPFVLISDATPLPVTWLDLSAECNNGDVTVQWSTASEQNSAFFSVERSMDGTNFTDVATNITAAGQSTTIKTYTFVDTDPFSGTSFYRIRETDFNASGTMVSSPITVNDCSDNMSIFVYPNPAIGSSTLNVSVTGIIDAEVLIVVTDMLGRNFYSKVTLLSSEKEVIAIDPSHQLAAGVYTIVATSKNEIQKRKIVIQ